MRNFKRIQTLGLFILLFAKTVSAEPNGQIEFDDLSPHYGEPKVEINLSANLMNMIGSFAKNADPEIGEVLAGLEFIKIRTYNHSGDVEHANLVIDKVSKKLKKDKWETLVTVNDYQEKEQVRIFSKTTKETIDGIVVMVVSPEKEGGEAVFINIVGEVDMNKLAKITETLDININQ